MVVDSHQRLQVPVPSLQRNLAVAHPPLRHPPHPRVPEQMRRHGLLHAGGLRAFRRLRRFPRPSRQDLLSWTIARSPIAETLMVSIWDAPHEVAGVKANALGGRLSNVGCIGALMLFLVSAFPLPSIGSAGAQSSVSVEASYTYFSPGSWGSSLIFQQN